MWLDVTNLTPTNYCTNVLSAKKQHTLSKTPQPKCKTPNTTSLALYLVHYIMMPYKCAYICTQLPQFYVYIFAQIHLLTNIA